MRMDIFKSNKSKKGRQWKMLREVQSHKRKKRKTIIGKILCMALCMGFVLLSGGCKKDTEIILTTGFRENEVFRIEGMPCYVPEIMIYLTNIQNQYEDVYGEEIFRQTIDGIPIEESIKQTVLARIAKIKMMNLMAENYGVTLDDQEKQMAKSAAAEYFNSLSEAEIEAMGGITEETVLQLYEEYALANKLYQYLVKDVNQEISDDEARTVTVQQIVLSTVYRGEDGELIPYSQEEKTSVYRKAEEICTRIASGEEFEKLASEYSDEEEHTAYYRKGEYEEALETAVFNLAQNEVSQIVEGTQGYYIFLCVSTYDMEQTEAAKLEILRERQQSVFGSIYDVFIGDKHCYLNEELWNTVAFTTEGTSATSNFFDIYTKYFP